MAEPISEAYGTFECPICGVDKPHYHPPRQVDAYHADQVRRDGWTSSDHRQPKESGWYLCLGIEIAPEQYGKKKDFWAPNERWSQLSWFQWVRDGGTGYRDQDIQEVLYFDRLNGWRLRNLLGNAVPSGDESRFEVRAKPKYWRDLPAGIVATAEPANV